MSSRRNRYPTAGSAQAAGAGSPNLHAQYAVLPIEVAFSNQQPTQTVDMFGSEQAGETTNQPVFRTDAHSVQNGTEASTFAPEPVAVGADHSYPSASIPIQNNIETRSGALDNSQMTEAAAQTFVSASKFVHDQPLAYVQQAHIFAQDFGSAETSAGVDSGEYTNPAYGQFPAAEVSPITDDQLFNQSANQTNMEQPFAPDQTFTSNAPVSYGNQQTDIFPSGNYPADSLFNAQQVGSFEAPPQSNAFQPYASFDQSQSLVQPEYSPSHYSSGHDEYSTSQAVPIGYQPSLLEQPQGFNPFSYESGDFYSQPNLGSHQSFTLPNPMQSLEPEAVSSNQPSYYYEIQHATANIPTNEASIEDTGFYPPEPAQYAEQLFHNLPATGSFQGNLGQPPLFETAGYSAPLMAQSAQVNCSNCNYPNGVEANFCCKCGARIAIPVEQVKQPEPMKAVELKPKQLVRNNVCCILPNGNLALANGTSMHICKLNSCWELNPENKELIQAIVNRKDLKGMVKKFIQSKDKYEFESVYLFNSICETDKTKLKDMFLSTHNLPSAIAGSEASSPTSPLSVSLETNEFITNGSVQPLLEKCLNSGQRSTALAISYLLGNQNDFLFCLHSLLQAQPPIGMLRVLLGIHFSYYSLDLLDPATVRNWWKEIVGYLVANQNLCNDQLIRHIFDVLCQCNQIAASVVKLLFDLRDNVFLSVHGNPLSIHTLSLENWIINQIALCDNGSFWLLKALQQCSPEYSGKYYSNYKWEHLDATQRAWINATFNGKSDSPTKAGGMWNFKIPNVMDVMDRVFIGTEEQSIEKSSKSDEAAKYSLSAIDESNLQEVVPPFGAGQKVHSFPITPPFNSGKKEAPMNADLPAMDNAQSTVPAMYSDGFIQESVSTIQSTSLGHQTTAQNILSHSIVPQAPVGHLGARQESAPDLTMSESENFHSPVLKPTESPASIYSHATQSASLSDSSSANLASDSKEDKKPLAANEKKTSYFGLLKGIFKAAKSDSSSTSSLSKTSVTTSTKDGLVQANLGEENSFIYDPELKVWRDKNQPIDQVDDRTGGQVAAPPPMLLPTAAVKSSTPKGTKSRYVEVL